MVGGLVFGLGANFSHTKKNFLKYAGMNLLPAVFISKGLDKVIHFSEYKHMIIGVILSIMIGAVLYFVINRNEAFRKNNRAPKTVLCVALI